MSKVWPSLPLSAVTFVKGLAISAAKSDITQKRTQTLNMALSFVHTSMAWNEIMYLCLILYSQRNVEAQYILLCNLKI